MGRFSDLYNKLTGTPSQEIVSNEIPQLKSADGNFRQVSWGNNTSTVDRDEAGKPFVRPMDILEQAKFNKQVEDASAMANIGGIAKPIKALAKGAGKLGKDEALSKFKDMINERPRQSGMGKALDDTISEMSETSKLTPNFKGRENIQVEPGKIKQLYDFDPTMGDLKNKRRLYENLKRDIPNASMEDQILLHDANLNNNLKISDQIHNLKNVNRMAKDVEAGNAAFRGMSELERQELEAYLKGNK